MTYTFFNQKFDNGMNKGLRWFGINLMVCFQDITQNIVWNLAKTHIQLTLKFANSTWGLLLSYIDDTKEFESLKLLDDS